MEYTVTISGVPHLWKASNKDLMGWELPELSAMGNGTKHPGNIVEKYPLELNGGVFFGWENHQTKW